MHDDPGDEHNAHEVGETLAESSPEANVPEQSPPDRRGDIGKCPACGSTVDPEAFHCPTCQNDYCFHCRARLLPSDTQLQCENPHCNYYGKLTCSLCDTPVEEELEPSIYREPEDGYWPAWLAAVILLMSILWYATSFTTAIWSALIIYAIGGFAMHRMGLNIFGKEREVEQRRRIVKHPCICCGQPAKRLELK